MLRTAFFLFFYIVTLCVKAETYKIPKITITSPYVKQMIEFAVSHVQECYPQCCNLTILPKDYSIIIQEMSPYFQVTFLTEEYLDQFGPFVGYTTCDNYKLYILLIQLALNPFSSMTKKLSLENSLIQSDITLHYLMHLLTDSK